MSGRGALLFGGRWNPPDVVSTVYLAFPEETCVAEFLKVAETQARGASSFAPRSIHTFQLTNIELLDLTAPGSLEAVGLSLADIESSDRRACQAVGETAHYLIYQGVLAPSSTGIGNVIAVFEPRVRPGQLALVETRPLSSVFSD